MAKRFVGGVSRYVEEDEPRRCECGGDLPTQAWPRCKPCDRDRKRAERQAQPAGVYLAVLKNDDGSWLLKVGHTTSVRSRAGRIASDAFNKHSIEATWAEVLYFIEVEDEEDRLELEATILASVGPDLGDEYFDAHRWDEFVVFRMMGEEYTARRTSIPRRDEFFAWLEHRE